MSWTYSPEKLAESKKDQVRLTIGDTDPDMPLMHDEEIDFMLSKPGSSVINVSILCVRRIIAKLSQVVDHKIGPESVSASDKVKHYRALLTQLLKEAASASTMSLSVPVSHEPLFDIGMNDNEGSFWPEVTQWTR